MVKWQPIDSENKNCSNGPKASNIIYNIIKIVNIDEGRGRDQWREQVASCAKHHKKVVH